MRGGIRTRQTPDKEFKPEIKQRGVITIPAERLTTSINEDFRTSGIMYIYSEDPRVNTNSNLLASYQYTRIQTNNGIWREYHSAMNTSDIEITGVSADSIIYVRYIPYPNYPNYGTYTGSVRVGDALTGTTINLTED